jgi:hypothetical protein
VMLTLQYCIVVYSTYVRYKRAAVALNRKHPFWSAAELIQEFYDREMKAISNRPPGAVIHVPHVSANPTMIP